MKVLGLIKQSSAAKFIIADILEAFNRNNNEIMFIDFDLALKRFAQSERQERYNKLAELIVSINEFNPDIIVSYGIEIFTQIFNELDAALQISFFELFKNKPHLCFVFDFGEPFDENKEYIQALKKFQRHNVYFFVWDKEAIRIMNKCGVINVSYFPMAVNEKKYFEKQGVQRNKNICFLGGPTIERIQALESIADYGLEIYGYDEKNWKTSEKLSDCYKFPVKTQEDSAVLYSQFKCSINVTRPHGFSSLNMRVYEAIACGCVIITDDKADVYELFVPDKEIFVYKNFDELRSICKRLLNDAAKLESVKQYGISRVLNDHTYFKRIQAISAIIDNMILETEIFNKLFDAYKKNNFEYIKNIIVSIKEEDIVINKIYYFAFKSLLSEQNVKLELLDNARKLSRKNIFVNNLN